MIRERAGEFCGESKQKECVAYFKNRKGFDRLFKGFRTKYAGLGHIGGSVTLDHLSQEEKESFEGFFQKSFQKQKSAVISAKRMERSLAGSRFYEVSLYDLLDTYFEGELETKEQERNRVELEKKEFWSPVIKKYEATFSGSWLLEVRRSKGKAYQFMNQKHKEYGGHFYSILTNVLDSGNALPAFRGAVERLPLFSARMTGNPHFFDEGKVGNRILTYLVEYYVQLEESSHKQNEAKTAFKKVGGYSAERKNELFYRAGILKEDILNYTNAYGIKLKKENGKFHLGVEGFYQEQQPMQISLLTLGGITDVWSVTKKVFIVENSGVFSEISGRIINEAALVCTNGQLHLASLILLDLFYNANYEMYYSGDFDPEGLQIAQKLKDRYGDRLCLWRYNEDSYEAAMSEVKLSDERVKKMKSLKEPKLRMIADLINITQKAGYQEQLTETYISDIKNNTADAVL